MECLNKSRSVIDDPMTPCSSNGNDSDISISKANNNMDFQASTGYTTSPEVQTASDTPRGAENLEIGTFPSLVSLD
jgi:hypothetical protein